MGWFHKPYGRSPAPGVLSTGDDQQQRALAHAEPILNVPQGINREHYPVDANAEVRTFDDFVAYCNAKGFIKTDLSDFFRTWMFYALTGPELKASDNLRQDFGGELTDDEARAYDAPFPSEIYMTGIRTLPSMGSMIDAQKSLADWQALQTFDKPFLTVFGQFDILVGSEKLRTH